MGAGLRRIVSVRWYVVRASLTLALLLSAVLGFAPSLYAQDDGIDPATEEAVMAALDAAMTAFVDGDSESVDALTADGFFQIDTEGVMTDRDAWVALPTQVDFTGLSARDVTLRMLTPDVVLGTAIFDVSGMFGETEWESSELDSFTLVNQDGEWRMASMHASERMTEAQEKVALIESALSAAPPAIADGATVMVPAADGSLTTLQEGDNGFVCLPDDPANPILDPICMDGEWLAFIGALLGGEEPDVQGDGIAYMLAGGATADNTDPFATEPPEGAEWLVEGPHIMIVAPGGFDEEVYSTEHGNTVPYIMWSGTPFEHLMVPIAAPAMEGMEGME